jgi:hypothetical protein
MTFEVEYKPDNSIRFTQPIMSSIDHAPPIVLTMTLSGSHLCLNHGGRRYIVSTEQLVIAWCEAVQAHD